MDKGQHLRLFIIGGTTQLPTSDVVAMSTELALHGAAQAESSTTKDTTDASGAVWDEYEVMGRSADIRFSSLVASGTDSGGKTFADMLSNVNDTLINWEICMASGANNRTKGQLICKGQGKMVSIEATGQVGQQSSYSGTINVFGPITPGTIST